MLEGAQRDLARYQALVAQNSIAKQTAEDQAATVKQERGHGAADQGSVAAAQVNVRYCRIVSPVDGRVGVRLVDPGNVVTTAHDRRDHQRQPDPADRGDLHGAAGRLPAPGQRLRRLPRPLVTQAVSQETGADLGSGELVVADNHVDQTTGTVALKARFPNPTRQLWPGQFVNVSLTLQTLTKAVTVPAAAVNQGPKGAFVYLVGSDNKVVDQPVKVLTTQGAVAVIQSGLTPGQTVVSPMARCR